MTQQNIQPEDADNSVLTIVLADAILTGEDYAQKMKTYFWRHPDAGYGDSFRG